MEIREARREENRRRAMEERRCFECGGFGHMASHCRNRGVEELTLVSSNRFEVLKVRVIQKREEGGKEIVRDKREILREEKVKRGVEKKEKVLREVTVKIRLKQEEEEERIVIKIVDNGLNFYLSLLILFYFSFFFFFYFLFLEQLGLEFISHAAISVTG